MRSAWLLSYTSYEVFNGFLFVFCGCKCQTSADIGLVVKCKNKTFCEDKNTYYITCDDSVDFDAIHSSAVKEITKEEYEMFLPRNKRLYDFAARIET